MDGLVGPGGIWPLALRAAPDVRAPGSLLQALLDPLFELVEDRPSLLCGAGIVLAVLAAAGVARLYALALCWVLYLALYHAGGPFLNFQWDVLLLETGFTALFLAPAALLPGRAVRDPPRAAVWLLRLLVVRFWFASGAVKWLWQDETWRDLTALAYHYETQPLPSPLAWTAHHLPLGFHKMSAGATYVVECGAPLLVFLGRWPRLVAAALFAGLQVLILLTGNYGWFNLLTLVLCIPLLDDRFLGRKASPPPAPPSPTWVRRVRAVPMAAVFLLSLVVFDRGLREPVPLPRFAVAAADSLDEWRVAGSYGLFRVMTRERPEIVVEGSADGEVWKAYAFMYKPGDPARAPTWLVPHMPRLDWQMWFAALRSRPPQWFLRFEACLLAGSPEVLDLLDANPFPDGPPRYVRATLYLYRFTTAEERAATGAVWHRELLGAYTLPVERRRE